MNLKPLVEVGRDDACDRHASSADEWGRAAGAAAGRRCRVHGRHRAYPTIQSAVNAPACATIRVPAGTFRENVTIGRSLAVRGAGPERTTVDASGKNSPVFAISSPPGVRQPCDPPVFIVTLAGMTMTGGTGPGDTFRNATVVPSAPARA